MGKRRQICRLSGRSRLEVNAIANSADVLDRAFDNIVVDEPFRRLEAHADTCGGAKEDEVARNKRAALAEPGDGFGDTENHVTCAV